MLSPEFNNEIQQQLAEIEDKKQISQKKIRSVWFTFGIVFIFCAILYFSLPSIGSYFIGIAIISLIVVIIIHVKNAYSYRKHFKNLVLSPMLNSDDSGIQYSPKNHITYSEFSNSNIFKQSADRFKGEDLFFGKREKTAYKFSEIHAEYKTTTTDSNGNTRTTYHTIFKGIFMIADFNKKLTTTTRVIQARDGFFEKLFSWGKKVTLENPDFEKKFNTYSDNQVEARYILTPAMMEKIMELSDRFKVKIDLSFKRENVYIALHSHKNHFELNSKQEINAQQVEQIYKEIESCISIIEILDLNTRIWTKE